MAAALRGGSGLVLGFEEDQGGLLGLREEGPGPPLCLMVEGLLGARFPARALGCPTIQSPTLAAHILQVVVEVHGTRTQVAPQQCGVSGEDGCHWQAPGTAQTQANACQPFVEVGDHVGLLFVLGQELWGNRVGVTVFPHGTEGTAAMPIGNKAAGER